ncbi:Inner membrane protein YdcO [Roseovarius albus]|uniref:Inner membrane protein YdcO n=1 Tax=Roseovarius albus TaxID=1247867 RepID=A0A1X7A7V0_9RHOB|nr:benzoate/H(+) symporter BenE family transporter [Roseovarius albus]SLN72617.1 Inner membrane protein YdcO [Roseovarius albus]
MRAGFPSLQTLTTGAVVAIVGFFSSFPIVLQGLHSMGATPAQAASGLMAAALSMGLCAVVLCLYTRIPASVAWSTPGAALLAVTAVTAGGFSDAVGAFIVAGALTLTAGLYRPFGRLAASIPAPLAQAMLAGVLLPLCLQPVTAMAEVPAVIGPVVMVWLICGRINRLLAVPAAVLMATAIIFVIGDFSQFSAGPVITMGEFVTPTFSIDAVIGIAIPLFIVTMATQNVPGLAVLKSYGYTPPPTTLLSGVGGFSVVSALWGAPATCLAAITAAMCSNEDCHPDPAQRYWSAVFAGIFYCFFGLFAGVITAFAGLAPPMLVASVAGLALVGVLGNSTFAALQDADYRDAAAITFLVTASGVTAFGLGAAVWGLLAGGIVQILRKGIVLNDT